MKKTFHILKISFLFLLLSLISSLSGQKKNEIYVYCSVKQTIFFSCIKYLETMLKKNRFETPFRYVLSQKLSLNKLNDNKCLQKATSEAAFYLGETASRKNISLKGDVSSRLLPPCSFISQKYANTHKDLFIKVLALMNVVHVTFLPVRDITKTNIPHAEIVVKKIFSHTTFPSSKEFSSHPFYPELLFFLPEEYSTLFHEEYSSPLRQHTSETASRLLNNFLYCTSPLEYQLTKNDKIVLKHIADKHGDLPKEKRGDFLLLSSLLLQAETFLLHVKELFYPPYNSGVLRLVLDYNPSSLQSLCFTDLKSSLSDSAFVKLTPRIKTLLKQLKTILYFLCPKHDSKPQWTYLLLIEEKERDPDIAHINAFHTYNKTSLYPDFLTQKDFLEMSETTKEKLEYLKNKFQSLFN